MNWKSAGKMLCRAAREMWITPDSSGSRSTSRTRRSHSGNSSRNSTPWCASEISPGRGSLPPPTSATALAVWCGARNGRHPQAFGRNRPASDEIAALASASSSDKRRQETGQPLGEHGLPGAGRAHHQQAVGAGCGDGERSLRGLLAAHVGKIGRASPRRRTAAADPRAARAPRVPSDARTRRGATPPDRRTAPRTSTASAALSVGSTKARPSRRADSAIGSAPRIGRSAPPSASSPANSNCVSAVGRNLAGGREDADRDRQIVAARLLGQIGGREIDGDLARRKFELRVLQRRAHAIARLLDLGVRAARRD